MKKIRDYSSILMVVLLSNFAQAQQATKIVSGFRGIQQLVVQISMVVGPLAFIAAGLVFYKNKQEGNEKLSGAFYGTILIGASSIIFSTIYSLFN